MTALSDARALAPSRGMRRAEFLRVFNLYTVAVVFYLCLGVVVPRFLPMLALEFNQISIKNSFTFLRQNLISGITVLATIAAVRAWALGRGWARGRSLAAAVACVSAATIVSAAFRLLAVGTPVDEFPSRWPWAIGVWFLWTLMGGMAYAMFQYIHEDEAARSALEEERSAQEALTAQMTQARLSALQAQIEPHFLFNTLANVKRLYETAPARGREMLSSLIGYLRAALPTMRQSGSSLRREVELARSYLTILQMRMGERLRFAIDVPESLLDAEVPPLVLGTLIENALKHGLAPLPAGGSIQVRALREADQLRIEVRDTGRGFSGEGGTGVGLANTRSRLAALYGGAAAVQLAANHPSGVVATVVLPLAPRQRHPARQQQEVTA
ncbi:MAG TPA: histidine kinase [Burkholderiaceae bacterium]|nr:histidine kinase [Burkholderiaceae bacterium]